MDLSFRNTNKEIKIVNIVSLILAILVGFSIFYFKKTEEITHYLIIKTALSLLLLFPISIIIHELGHMTFGLLSGYKFLSFKLLCFQIIKTNGKLKFKFIKAMVLGQCLMTFKDDPRDMKYKSYMYGGSIFNLVISILSLIASIIIFIFKGYFLVYTQVLFFINIYMFICNGIPLNIRGIYNDALNLKLMNKYDEYRFTILNTLKLEECMDSDYEIEKFPIYVIENSGYDLPNHDELMFPFLIIRTIKMVMEDKEDPFRYVKEVHLNRFNYPKIYQDSNIVLYLFYMLINDFDYRGILYLKEYKHIFKKPEKRDPLVMLDMSLIKIKEDGLGIEKGTQLLKEKELLIDKAKELTRIENLYYHKLYSIAYKYLRSKEEIVIEDYSNNKRGNVKSLLY